MFFLFFLGIGATTIDFLEIKVMKKCYKYYAENQKEKDKKQMLQFQCHIKFHHFVQKLDKQSFIWDGEPKVFIISCLKKKNCRDNLITFRIMPEEWG